MLTGGPDGVKTWNFDQYDWVDQYDERMRGAVRLCYDRAMERLAECADAQAGEDVLDLGTGTGNSALPFLRRGCRVLGLDPSERMLRQAEAKVAEWQGLLTVRHASDPFLAIHCPDATFDVVVSAFAIHHVPDESKPAAVREAKRVLRPLGRIVIADTMFLDADHKRRGLQENPDMDDEYQPLLTTFPAMFEAEGFRVQTEQVGPWVWILVARQPGLV